MLPPTPLLHLGVQLHVCMRLPCCPPPSPLISGDPGSYWASGDSRDPGGYWASGDPRDLGSYWASGDSRDPGSYWACGDLRDPGSYWACAYAHVDAHLVHQPSQHAATDPATHAYPSLWLLCLQTSAGDSDEAATQGPGPGGGRRGRQTGEAKEAREAAKAAEKVGRARGMIMVAWQ